MRFFLLLIVIIAIAALVQSKRHGCKFGSDDWLNCVIDNSKKEYYSAAPSEMRWVQASAKELSASSM